MTMTDPTFLERLRPHWKLIVTAAGLVVLIGAVAFIFDRCDAYRTKRSDEKMKEAINANLAEVSNLTEQITNLQIRREGVVNSIERDTEDLQNNIYGREEAKTEANKALANYQRALNSNSNVDRTAEDLERILRELEK